MNGVLKSFESGGRSIIDDRHPPVVRSRGLAVHVSVIPAGTIVAKNGAGAIVVYDPDGSAPVNVPCGVLARDAETDADAAAVLEHGCVFEEALLVKGSPAAAAHITALETNTVIFVTRSE